MKKLTVFLCTAFLACTPSLAQEAKTCFVNMPDSLSPMLSAVNRADCIDFLESNMKAEVTNAFGGKSQMTVLAPDYIRIQMTTRSTWQMKLLTVNDTTRVICTISTVHAPVADSHIRFYTTDWQPLPTTRFLLSTPVLTDFLREIPDTADIYSYQRALRQADLPMVRADLAPADDRLSFTLTTPDYMEKEAADKLKPFIRRPLIYVWRQGRFVPQAPATSL